ESRRILPCRKPQQNRLPILHPPPRKVPKRRTHCNSPPAEVRALQASAGGRMPKGPAAPALAILRPPSKIREQRRKLPVFCQPHCRGRQNAGSYFFEIAAGREALPRIRTDR